MIVSRCSATVVAPVAFGCVAFASGRFQNPLVPCSVDIRLLGVAFPYSIHPSQHQDAHISPAVICSVRGYDSIDQEIAVDQNLSDLWRSSYLNSKTNVHQQKLSKTLFATKIFTNFTKKNHFKKLTL